MSRVIIFILSALIFSLVMCKSQKDIHTESSIRQIRPADVRGFHNPIEMTIAWYPYENKKLTMTSKHEWKIEDDENGRQGNVPVILIRYPLSGDSIWLDMNTKSEDLGMLIKHTLMTQIPIKRPFTNYLEAASCTGCHPEDVEVDFKR
ncbi:MAG: hypothetical protein RH860_00620 [Cytophagales bacterium]